MIRAQTPDEIFRDLVRIGVYTPDGELTPHYRRGVKPKKKPPTGKPTSG